MIECEVVVGDRYSEFAGRIGSAHMMYPNWIVTDVIYNPNSNTTVIWFNNPEKEKT